MSAGQTGGIGVLGTGSHLPATMVTNDQVGAPAGVDDAWITRKTGIRGRRWAEPGETTSDLCLAAAQLALKEAGTDPDLLRLIIVATSTPDSPQPPTAAVLAARLGAPAEAAAFDLNSVCSGFVFALETARRFLAADAGTAGGDGGPYGADAGRALVVAADVYSRAIDPEDRRTVVLLGDGAGAAVLGPVPAAPNGSYPGGAGAHAGRDGDRGGHRDGHRAGDHGRAILGSKLLTFGTTATWSASRRAAAACPRPPRRSRGGSTTSPCRAARSPSS
ncbi:hypothetical protein GEV43_24135 [Actinomadura sp. J1-007]|uniref:hypothetical protein n=1 Tax=Actinomadura sp. J1-007 TaxID=2661913 RepID=UPI00132841BE|nr:hypothetical protein [Actinomadura sp. J1-007]MWK36845.1 hypothetical protein [Actinomadura sp. J1-007]